MKRKMLLGSALALLLAAIGAAGFLWQTPELRYAAARVQYLTELGGVQSVEGPLETRALYEYTIAGRKVVPTGVEGYLVDYAVSSAGAAALTNAPGTTRMQVVRVGAQSKVLVDDDALKASISIASDGTIAYAALDSEVRRDDVLKSVNDFYNPSHWRVMLVSQTGSTTEMGEGMAPRFFRHEGKLHLLVTEAGKITIRPLQEGGASLSYKTTTLGVRPAEVSSEGKYLAIFNHETSTYEPYALTRAGDSFAIEKVEVATDKLIRASFNGDRLVAIGLTRGEEPLVPRLEVIDLAAGGSAEILYSGTSLLETTKMLTP